MCLARCAVRPCAGKHTLASPVAALSAAGSGVTTRLGCCLCSRTRARKRRLVRAVWRQRCNNRNPDRLEGSMSTPRGGPRFAPVLRHQHPHCMPSATGRPMTTTPPSTREMPCAKSTGSGEAPPCMWKRRGRCRRDPPLQGCDTPAPASKTNTAPPALSSRATPPESLQRGSAEGGCKPRRGEANAGEAGAAEQHPASRGACAQAAPGCSAQTRP